MVNSCDFYSYRIIGIVLSLTKSTVLRIMLDIDGVSITSKSHIHPSHSQTSGLLTSSLSFGVPVPRTTQCLRGVQITQLQFLVFHRTDIQNQVLFLALALLFHNKQLLQFTSRLLTSSLSLGVPVPHGTQCMSGVQIPQFYLLAFHHTDTHM